MTPEELSEHPVARLQVITAFCGGSVAADLCFPPKMPDDLVHDGCGRDRGTSAVQKDQVAHDPDSATIEVMGDRSFGYSAQLKPLLWVFLVLTPVEILLVDVLVPWFWLRAVLLVFGLLSGLLLAWLLWMLHKFKHEIDDEYLWLRYAREFEYRIPRNAIETVTHGMTSRSLNKTRSVVDETLVLEISSSTNVRVTLNEPQEIDLGRRGAHQITKIEFWADDPERVVRALRK
jgi:hypothetical protein